MQRILLPLILLIFCVQTNAQYDSFQTKVPQEVRKFILKDYKVYDYREGDLNGDGRKDAILILQNKKQGEYDSVSDDYLDFPVDVAEAFYQTVNFVYVFYSGTDDKYSSGFILKKHLKLFHKPIKAKQSSL